MKIALFIPFYDLYLGNDYTIYMRSLLILKSENYIKIYYE